VKKLLINLYPNNTKAFGIGLFFIDILDSQLTPFNSYINKKYTFIILKEGEILGMFTFSTKLSIKIYPDKISL
jgi:hypothetical protein